MTKQTTTRVAKRSLKNIDFSSESAHIALVSKQQGGPASGADYSLVLKANSFSPEYIEKMQQIRVTMEIPEFLRTFFGLYYDEAAILAGLMGYVTDTTEQVPVETYADYIQSELQAFEIIKAAYDAESFTTVLSELSQEQYLALLEDQALIEKALRKKNKKVKPAPMLDIGISQGTQGDTTVTPVMASVTKSELVASATESDNSTNASVEKTVEPSGSEITKSKETQMTKAIKTETIDVAVEMVEKSALESIQKSLEDNQVALTKALEAIAIFEQEKKEQVVKSKTAKFSAILKDEKVLTPVVKAALSLESDEDFDAFLAAITAMQANVVTSQEFMEKSALFKEVGATVSEEDTVKESAVARILKSKQANTSKE